MGRSCRSRPTCCRSPRSAPSVPGAGAAPCCQARPRCCSRCWKPRSARWPRWPTSPKSATCVSVAVSEDRSVDGDGAVRPRPGPVRADHRRAVHRLRCFRRWSSPDGRTSASRPCSTGWPAGAPRIVSDTPGVTRDRKEAEADAARPAGAAGRYRGAGGERRPRRSTAGCAPRAKRRWREADLVAVRDRRPRRHHAGRRAFRRLAAAAEPARAAGRQQGRGPRRARRRRWRPMRSAWATRWRSRPSTARASPT